MNKLESGVDEELVSWKEYCYRKEKLDLEGIRKYERRINGYKIRGFGEITRRHELILDILYRRMNTKF